MANTLTTHVLDTSLGRPAAGIAVVLERQQGSEFIEISTATTNDDGRAPELLATGGLLAGVYRLRFATAAYFARDERPCFYPEVAISFEVTRPTEHHHVPLLLSPFGYSTYRGS